MNRKILIIAPYYLPFVKGGGPIQSIKNIVETLSEKYDFYIVTNCCDHGEVIPSDKIVQENWQTVGNANVFYIASEQLTMERIKGLLLERTYDKVYLNSFFSWIYSIKWVFILNYLNESKKIIIAPRGELSAGALRFKKIKKMLFYNLARISGIYKKATWHATAKIEKDDILKHMGKVDITVAANFVDKSIICINDKKNDKEINHLKLVFLSRIHPKKNLRFALELLKNIKGSITFDIYGPIEDPKYWEQCQDTINTLPKNIIVRYKGTLKHERVNLTLKNYHVLLFPTFGENFGHVIAEAFMAGIPIIVSDQTPWRQLKENGVGYDIPLVNKKQYIDAINYYASLNCEQYNRIAVNISNYIENKFDQRSDIENIVKIFG